MENVVIEPDMGIHLSDGTRLSARVWMPESCQTAPCPAILEYLPYRKSDGTAARDAPMHLHVARQRYVCLRVDRRGCGDSEGLFDDEYSEQELADGEEIIAWIAGQEWCDGNVGIQGISWGGFNGLQLAARQPPALKAVISIGTTVDRYNDDIHYKGGIQLGENIGWAATVMSWFSMPPDPAIVGPKWRDMWLDRLDHAPFLAGTWSRERDRSAYWKHGSVCEDFASIKAPVLAMGGFHDGYRNAMAALAENVEAPVVAIAGPWNHKYPHISTIEPKIDYLNLAVRWWDKWLKGIDNGAETDPRYQAYAMDSIPPARDLKHRPGAWVAEANWPSAAVCPEPLHLSEGTLGAAGPLSQVVPYDLACGQACGEYFPFGFGSSELPDEQSADDAVSACFESIPLAQDRILLGAPELRLSLSCDEPRGQVVARLCDVAPDGTSALICLGMLNLVHRTGFDAPRDLVPGKTYQVMIPLDQCAYRLPKGHKLRLAISSSYWPYAWPEARPFALTLTGGVLTCPWLDRDITADEVRFDAPGPLEHRPQTVLTPAVSGTSQVTDPLEKRLDLSIIGDHGSQRDEITGLITSSKMAELWSIERDDPGTAAVHITWDRSLARDGTENGFSVRTQVVTDMRAVSGRFEITQTLKAWDGAELVCNREFSAQIDRLD